MANLISQITLPNNTTYTVKDGTITAGTGISITTDASTGARTIANTGITSISVSNSWTDGTTAGPTLSTTVSGVTGTAVAIPAATSEKSGVVTTTTQTFAGSKTFNGNSFEIQADSIILKNKNTSYSNYPTDKFYLTGIKFVGDSNTGIYCYSKAGATGYTGSVAILSDQLLITGKEISVYSNSKTYSINDIVAYDNKLYRCVATIETAEDWNSSHWGALKNAGAGIYIRHNTMPLIHDTYDLGTTYFRWNAVYTKELHINGITNLGSETRPIYWNSYAPSVCSTYAGGTAVTLNGTDKGASTASFYAPTSAGTDGYHLVSSGSGAPTWKEIVASKIQYKVPIRANTALSAGKLIWKKTDDDGYSATFTYNNSSYRHTYDLKYPILYSPKSVTAGSYSTETYLSAPDLTSSVFRSDVTFVAGNKVYIKGIYYPASNIFKAGYGATCTLEADYDYIIIGTVDREDATKFFFRQEPGVYHYDGTNLYQVGTTGTAVTLNGTDKSASTASFYAPTGAGTSNQYLKSNGSGEPSWTDFPTIPSITLNGSASTSPSFYAPTTAGTSGYLLTSSGSGAPTWSAAPDISAMVKYSGTLTSGEVVTTSGTDGTVVSSGYTIEKSVPSTAAFTDMYVKQGPSTTSGWRKALFTGRYYADPLSEFTEQINIVLAADPIEAQPSTGTLRANIFDLKNKAQIQYNTTDDSIDFVFT